MQQGFISLHRQIQEHWLFTERRQFSKFEAWMDILLMVNHKAAKVMLGNELIDVKRGETITSELKLMSRWGWSKSKLRNFFKMLTEDGMIQIKSDKKKTTVLVLNYSKFQHGETTERPHEDHKETTERPQKDTNNNDNNNNNENNENNIKQSPDGDRDSVYKNKKIELEKAFEKFWNLYPKKVNKKKAEQRFMNLSLKVLENLFVGLDLYMKKWKVEKTAKQYIPGPEVWIGNEKWTDEIVVEGSPNGRSEQEIAAAKKRKAEEDKKAAEESAKVAAEKKEVLDFWNSLSEEKHAEIKKQALECCLKRFPSWSEEKMKGQYGKPLLRAETGRIIKELMTK